MYKNLHKKSLFSTIRLVIVKNECVVPPTSSVFCYDALALEFCNLNWVWNLLNVWKTAYDFEFIWFANQSTYQHMITHIDLAIGNKTRVATYFYTSILRRLFLSVQLFKHLRFFDCEHIIIVNAIFVFLSIDTVRFENSISAWIGCCSFEYRIFWSVRRWCGIVTTGIGIGTSTCPTARTIDYIHCLFVRRQFW